MEPEIHKSTDDARAGSTPHIVRYVLAISLFLAIAALTIIWITGALNHSADVSGPAAPTSEAAGH